MKIFTPGDEKFGSKFFLPALFFFTPGDKNFVSKFFSPYSLFSLPEMKNCAFFLRFQSPTGDLTPSYRKR
jgi:hypothetical protein